MANTVIKVLVSGKEKFIHSLATTVDFLSVRVGASNLEIKESGTYAGHFDFAGKKLTNMMAAANAGDAVEFSQLNTILSSYVLIAQKGAANGVATLDGSSFVPLTQLSGITTTQLSATAGIVYSQLSIADGSFTIAKTSGLQAALDAKLSLSGGTMTGDIIMGVNKITSSYTPTNATDLVNKAYADAISVNQDYQADVIAKQVDNTLDPGATPTNSDRYIITDAGNLHANFGTINKFMNGDAAVLGNNDIVQYVSANSEFRIAFDASAHTTGGVLVWITAIEVFNNYTTGGGWTEFGGLAGVTNGAGLGKTGNTLFVKMGAGIIELPTGEVGLDLAVGGGLELTSVLTGGQLQIAALGVTNAMLAGSITYAKLSIADDDIPQAKINGLTTSLAGKEPTITAGTISQYYRGDKTFQTLDTAAVAENTNLYFTAARAKTAVVLNTLAGSETDQSPSVFAVNTALALKANDNIVVKTVNGVSPTAGAVTISTSNVSEGTNLYFTDGRAQTAVVASSVTNGDTTHAPSGNAVYAFVTGLVGSSDTMTLTNDHASAITIRQVVYMKSNGHVDLAEADALVSSDGTLGIVADSSIATAGTGLVTIKPGARIAGFTGLTPSTRLYLSATTAGELTATPPSTVGNTIRAVAYAISATEIIFMPSDEAIEILS